MSLPILWRTRRGIERVSRWQGTTIFNHFESITEVPSLCAWSRLRSNASSSKWSHGPAISPPLFPPFSFPFLFLFLPHRRIFFPFVTNGRERRDQWGLDSPPRDKSLGRINQTSRTNRYEDSTNVCGSKRSSCPFSSLFVPIVPFLTDCSSTYLRRLCFFHPL